MHSAVSSTAGLKPMVPLSSLVAVALTLSFGPFSGALQAQDNRHVEWTAACPECRLSVQPLLRLSAEEEAAGPIDAVWMVARDIEGRYWASFAGADPPRVYSRSGTPLGPIGRLGEGPGEFRSVLGVVPVADSIVLFDPVLGRMTVVTPDLQPARSISVAGQVFRGVALDWPRIAVNALIFSSNGSGHPFHILNIETGRIEYSFGGSTGGEDKPRDRHAMLGYIAEDPITGELWTAARTQFRIQRWSRQGRLIETHTGLRNWFPADARGLHGSPSSPPHGLVNGVSTGRDGLLYLAIQLPARGWRAAWPAGAALDAGPHRPGRTPDRALLYDSFIAALDPSTGRIVTFRDVEYAVMADAHVESGFLAMEGLADLFPSLVVLGVSIDRHERP